MVGHMSVEGAAAQAPLPADIESLADYERHAAGRMAEASWRHIQSGSGRELTLAANRAAFDRIGLLPRVLTDVRGGSTRIELFGQHHATPILLAPVAYHRLAHAEGELATVRGAAALGIGAIVSTLSSISLEDIAAASADAVHELNQPAVPLWFQLYFQDSRAHSLSLVRRAEDAGYQAIVVTVDAAMKRAGFALPDGVEAVNLRGMGIAQQHAVPGDAILFGTPLIDHAPRWEDIAWLRAQTKLPLIIKGLMAADDARLSVEHGVDAIVVSNHGGRVLDGTPSALDVLPAMAAAIGSSVPLLLDGGVRSGTDTLKALALGAHAVLIGRPQLHALAVAGMIGVAHMLHLLRAELELGMAQLGCRYPADVSPGHLFGISHIV
jgi:4-hydroxymandelate oxidase